MKLLRSYALQGDIFYCKVDVLQDPVADETDGEFQSIFETIGKIDISMVVGPDAHRKTDFIVKSSGCSRSLLLVEIYRFCSTVKQMYDL